MKAQIAAKTHIFAITVQHLSNISVAKIQNICPLSTILKCHNRSTELEDYGFTIDLHFQLGHKLIFQR